MTATWVGSLVGVRGVVAGWITEVAVGRITTTGSAVFVQAGIKKRMIAESNNRNNIL